MLASLVFSPVADIGHKTLHAFRKDAGWTNLDSAAHEGALSPGSQVQWATARRSGKVIGIARLELAPPQFCYVSDLIVLGAYRAAVSVRG